MAPNLLFSVFSPFLSLSYAGFILSVWISVLFPPPLFSLSAYFSSRSPRRPTTPRFFPLRLLTQLLITKHTGAISADLQPTPVPLSIHPLPSVPISPSLPSFFSPLLVKSRFVRDPLGEQRQRAAAALRKVTVMYGPRRCRQGQACLNGDALNAHTAKSITAF